LPVSLAANSLRDDGYATRKIILFELILGDGVALKSAIYTARRAGIRA